jgi:hypothetical protein
MTIRIKGILIMEQDQAPDTAEEKVDTETQARREFIKKLAKASAAAPAVALLLAANSKSAQAGPTYGGGSGSS